MALKDIPESFNPDSEDDLRFAVALYFRELGFELDELSFEDRFHIQLGHNTLIVERGKTVQRDQIAGRSDLLLARNGEPIAIVETKAPDHALAEEDAWQAISYARLLLKMAPYTIVTNGQETQVYDTFADTLIPLPTPVDSLWNRNERRIPSIAGDLKFQAARTLVGVNPQTLKFFCQEQLAQALEDLRGTPYEGKIYVPDVYLPRQKLVDQFNAWLSSDFPCFAVVGDSGVGKTNFMCATAESLSEDNFVLFYPSMRLVNGLLAAIRNDFVWEFHREREPAYIVGRFNEITSKHGRDLIILVDGLDEFPGDRESFKAELLDLVYRLRGFSIRLCVSCKSFDWGDFVIDKGQTYNRLAKSTYPPRDPVHNPSEIQSPGPEHVGVWLSEFTDDELDVVYPNYQERFSLQGELRGATRVECLMPLMLRFVAEVYSGRDIDLPTETSSRELFDLYWDRRLSEVQQKFCAEQILSELARLSVESGERQIESSSLRMHLNWTDSMNEAYQGVIRLGLIRETVDGNGYRWLAFGFEKMRSYVYTVKARKWPLDEPRDTARMICELLANPLGVEAVEFYLTTIDRGETSVLAEVALLDFDCFVQLTCSFDLKSSITQDIPGDHRQTALWNRLTQYAVSYSEISRRYFPDLCERIEPYTKGDVGVWVHQSMYQLRTRTESVPQPVAVLSDEVVAGLWNRDVPPYVYAELQPAGMLYMGMHNIAEQLPQKWAWDRIRSQITGLFENRFLDESSSPVLLQERVWETLLYKPHWWVHECSNPRDRFWQLLGFENVEDIQVSVIGDLMVRVYSLLNEYQVQVSKDVAPGSLRGYPWWCFRQSQTLRRLYYWLELLHPLCEHLRLPRFEIGELFGYLRTNDLTPIVAVIKALLPDILDVYHSLILRNFSQIADLFAFFRFFDSHMLVEVTRNPRGGFGSDFITLGYIILPSVDLPEKHLVYTCKGKDSVAHIPLIRETLKGTVTSHGAKFGQASISRQVGDLHIEEPNAFLCFTRFPSRHPILDQVYQLLGNEAQYVLGGDFSEWHNVESGHMDDKKLDWWINRQWARRSKE